MLYAVSSAIDDQNIFENLHNNNVLSGLFVSCCKYTCEKRQQCGEVKAATAAAGAVLILASTTNIYIVCMMYGKVHTHYLSIYQFLPYENVLYVLSGLVVGDA